MSIRAVHWGIGVSFALLILLILCLALDVFQCASCYLYFSSELGTLFLAAVVAFAALEGVRWNTPPDPGDSRPERGWRHFSTEFLVSFAVLAGIMVAVWVAVGWWGGISASAWFKRALWSGYMLGVYAIFAVLIVRYIKFIHPVAFVTAITIMTYFLSTYEIILLDRGIGWHYNNTVIGTVLGIPLDNVLFIYPVSPAFAMIMFAIAKKHMNDLRAFVLINVLLIPASIVVELVAIYPLNIWRVQQHQSLWPIGKTSFEEFFFYVLMQLLSIGLYMYFCRAFKSRFFHSR